MRILPSGSALALSVMGAGMLMGLVATPGCYVPLGRPTTAVDPLQVGDPDRTRRRSRGPGAAATSSRPARRATRPSEVVSGQLTLRDLLVRLLKRTQRVKVLRSRKALAKAEAQDTGRIKNPELRIMNLSSALGDSDHGDLSIRLRWEPPMPGVGRARRVRAAARARLATARLSGAVYRQIAEVRELHARVSSTNRRIVLQKQLLDIQLRAHRHHQACAQAGTASHLRSDLARLRVLRIQTRLADLRARRSTLSARLLGLVELAPTVKLQPAPARPAAARPPAGLKALVSHALKNHPDLVALREQARAQHATLYIERSKRIPWFDFLQVAYDFGERQVADRFLFGVGIRLPILDWNRGGVGVASARLKLLKARREALRARIKGSISAALRATQAARRAVDRFQRETEPAMKRVLRRARASAKGEGVDLTEVFRVEILAVKLALAHLDQRLVWHRSRIRLDRLAARPVWRRYGLQVQDR